MEQPFNDFFSVLKRVMVIQRKLERHPRHGCTWSLFAQFIVALASRIERSISKLTQGHSRDGFRFAWIDFDNVMDASPGHKLANYLLNGVESSANQTTLTIGTDGVMSCGLPVQNSMVTFPSNTAIVCAPQVCQLLGPPHEQAPMLVCRVSCSHLMRVPTSIVL